MTAAEKRDKAHARMRQAYDDGMPCFSGSQSPLAQASFRAGFLAALRYARDEMPRVLTTRELERVGTQSQEHS